MVYVVFKDSHELRIVAHYLAGTFLCEYRQICVTPGDDGSSSFALIYKSNLTEVISFNNHLHFLLAFDADNAVTSGDVVHIHCFIALGDDFFLWYHELWSKLLNKMQEKEVIIILWIPNNLVANNFYSIIQAFAIISA